MDCCVCKQEIPGEPAWEERIEGDDYALCQACRDACPAHEPRKIVEAYYAQFSDDAGGWDDDRDHEDFRVGRYLVADGRIAEYLGPFGDVMTKDTIASEGV